MDGTGIATVEGTAPVAELEVRLVVGAATDTGGRAENEDSVLLADLAPSGAGPGAVEGGYLLAVADGMGGHQRGEVASRLAVETIERVFAGDPGADVALLLKQAYREANRVIYEGGRGNGDGQMMGTTLVVAATRGKYATIANIGDSRAYLVRANRLTQVTKDHSLVAEQVSQGHLTREQARESPHRNIVTQALGHRAALDRGIPDVFELTLLPEDRLLLCSDGFYEVVNDDDFVGVLLEHEPEAAVRRLIELANARGTTDNVSAVVAQILPAKAPAVKEVVVAPGGRGSFLVPALVALAAVLFIALVVLSLILL